MAVDYGFEVRYKTSAVSASGGNFECSSNSISGPGFTADFSKFYSRVGNGGVGMFDFATNSFTLLGALGGFSGNLRTQIEVDEANGAIYVCNGSNPGTIYRYLLSNLDAPTHSHTLPSGTADIRGFSRISQRLLTDTTIFNNTLGVVSSTFAGLGRGYLPASNEFLSANGNNNVTFLSPDGATLASVTGLGSAAGNPTVSGFYYSQSNNRAYVRTSTAGSGRLFQIDPSTRTSTLFGPQAGLISHNSSFVVIPENDLVVEGVAGTGAVATYKRISKDFQIMYAEVSTINNRHLIYSPTFRKILAVSLNTNLNVIDLNRADLSLTVPVVREVAIDLSGSSSANSIQFLSNNNVRINAPVNFFFFSASLGIAEDNLSSFDFDFELIENTEGLSRGNIEFNGTGQITGDFSQSFEGATLDLSTSTRATFTERITLDATSTVIVGASVNLEAFTFAAGTTVNADDGVGPYTVTVANNPGIVAGPGVTIAAPELTLTITGVPAGGIFTIWDDDDPDPQDLGTLLQETKPTSGGAILYQGTPGNNVIFQLVPKSGASLGFKEFNVAGVIPATSQTLNLSSSLVPETNI